MINLEKFLLTVAFAGVVTAHHNFLGIINTSAIAASYNADTNNSTFVSSDLASDLATKLSSNSALAIDKQNNVANLPPSIITAIQNDLRQRTGLEPSDYIITRATQRNWDGCLGLGRPEEVCLAILVQGWRVVVTSNNRRTTWIYRTNQNGSSIRLASPR